MKPEKDYADIYVEAYKRAYIDKNYKRPHMKPEKDYTDVYVEAYKRAYMCSD